MTAYSSHKGGSDSKEEGVHESISAPVCMGIMNLTLKYISSLQAKDKDRWIRLFSQFCNKTANEEEEIVHKLLGDKFKVGLPHDPPTPANSLGCLWLPGGSFTLAPFPVTGRSSHLGPKLYSETCISAAV